MELNVDAKFEGKLTFAFKNDTRNLGKFNQSTLKSRNWDFDKILLSKVENLWAWNLQGRFFVMIMKKDAKLEQELTCCFKIDMRNFMNFDPSNRKSKKFAL